MEESFPHLLTEFCTKLSTENVNKIAFLTGFLFITRPCGVSYPTHTLTHRINQWFTACKECETIRTSSFSLR